MSSGRKGRERGAYWLVMGALIAAQAWFTSHSTSQIRYEELAESVRNVYWLDERLVYDGISSNVGWYGLLLVTYKLFGFDIHTAKVLRLLLHAASMLCLADVLRRWMGEKRAIVPLLTIGLSPTLLSFNTMQTSYGLDLQLAPMCLWLLLVVVVRRTSTSSPSPNLSPVGLGGDGRQEGGYESARRSLATIALWSTSMIACMSYPTFLFYLPILAAWYWIGVRDAVVASAFRRTIGRLKPAATPYETGRFRDLPAADRQITRSPDRQIARPRWTSGSNARMRATSCRVSTATPAIGAVVMARSSRRLLDIAGGTTSRRSRSGLPTMDGMRRSSCRRRCIRRNDERDRPNVRLPPPRFALRRAAPKLSEGGKADATTVNTLPNRCATAP